jgi:hypothetical protein
MPLNCFDRLSFNSYNEQVRKEIMQYLQVVQEKLASALNRTKEQEKEIIDSLIRQTGGLDGLISLKQDYFNESLADLVLNRNELRKVYEDGNRFIRTMEPIYAMPVSRFGRAHFFSSCKQVGNHIISTLLFNVSAIWLMTLILYISLQFRWLAYLLRLLGGGNRKD